jgi:hypothetical protein
MEVHMVTRGLRIKGRGERGEGEAYFLGAVFILCCLISGAIACLGAIKDYKDDKLIRRDEQRYEAGRVKIIDDNHSPEGYTVDAN